MKEEIIKYVRLPGNDIIIFSKLLKHSAFIDFNPVTAGLCIIDGEKRKVDCFGESITLQLKADKEEDTRLATQQVFGDNYEFE